MIDSKARVSNLDVLIVDPRGETSEVIGTVLRRHGFATREVQDGAAGLYEMHRDRPAVAVVDMSDHDEATVLEGRFLELSERLGQRLILMRGGDQLACDSDAVRFFPKPYRFGPLIRTIEALIQERSAVRAS